ALSPKAATEGQAAPDLKIGTDGEEPDTAAVTAGDNGADDLSDEAKAPLPKDEEVNTADQTVTGRTGASLLGFMVLAFFGGLAALLTPCVFPMIPMTVTFFTGRSKSRAHGIKTALIYGLSIVAIYTFVGTLVAATQGPEFANWLATHW